VLVVLRVLSWWNVLVADPGKGVCADPVNRDAILGKGATGPGGGDKERQLSLDKEGDKT
jgi:hypothetical protein